MPASLIVCADGGANCLEEANQRVGKIDIVSHLAGVEEVRPLTLQQDSRFDLWRSRLATTGSPRFLREARRTNSP